MTSKSKPSMPCLWRTAAAIRPARALSSRELASRAPRSVGEDIKSPSPGERLEHPEAELLHRPRPAGELEQPMVSATDEFLMSS